MNLHIRKCSECIGVEVLGVDLASDMDAATIAAIERAFDENSVLLFRSQQISPPQQIEFAKQFGSVELNAMGEYLLPSYPEIQVISNMVENGRPIGYAEAGREWHTDMSYMPRPPRCSLLYAIKVPMDNGRPLGDTLFASTAAAYDALAPAMKQRLHGLKAIHRSSGRLRPAALTESARKNLNAVPDVVHPVVRTHPKTGRKSLYVNEGECVGIVGMPDDEALPLIKELFEFCIRPEFRYRHQWAAGDVLMWDNGTSQHLAPKDYDLPQERLMYRVTVNGVIPT